MEKDFKNLPQDAQERIVMRNGVSADLNEIQDQVEKADFLIQLIQGEYTVNTPNERELEKWILERSRICQLIDIARDYSYQAKNKIQELGAKLNEDNKCDRGEWGDGL